MQARDPQHGCSRKDRFSEEQQNRKRRRAVLVRKQLDDRGAWKALDEIPPAHATIPPEVEDVASS